jgi:hypothetical protein
VKRAVNVHPIGVAQPGKVSVVSTYVHNKVGAEVLPEHIQVSKLSLSSKRDGTRQAGTRRRSLVPLLLFVERGVLVSLLFVLLAYLIWCLSHRRIAIPLPIHADG